MKVVYELYRNDILVYLYDQPMSDKEDWEWEFGICDWINNRTNDRISHRFITYHMNQHDMTWININWHERTWVSID